MAITLAVVLLSACQTVAGIEDKQLDPAFHGANEAGTDASDGGTDAADDAKDAVSEPLDSSAEDAETGGARPPGRPSGDASPSDAGGSITFAIRRFFIGMVDPATEDNDPDAWRDFGFDYDGECTTREQSGLNESATCLRPTGANEIALEDGDECRDNLGGHLLSESLLVMDSSFEKKMHNGTWNATKPTILLQIEDLDEGPDDPYAPGRLYVTAPRTGIEKMLWDGNDLLQVDVDSLVGGVMPVSKYELPNAYVRNNVWVSGDFKGLPVVVPMMILNQIAPVPAETATMTVVLDEEHSEARGGMFAAVLDTLTLEPFLQIGMLEATGCNEVLTDMAMAMFLPNRDLGNGADFVVPDSECGLMSIGVGLELRRVRTPETAVEVTPVPSACVDGG